MTYSSFNRFICNFFLCFYYILKSIQKKNVKFRNRQSSEQCFIKLFFSLFYFKGLHNGAEWFIVCIQNNDWSHRGEIIQMHRNEIVTFINRNENRPFDNYMTERWVKFYWWCTLSQEIRVKWRVYDLLRCLEDFFFR